MQHLQLQFPCAVTGESTSPIPQISFIAAPQTDAFCPRVGACVQHYGTFCLTSSLRSDQLPIQKAHFRSDINRSVLVSSFFLVCSLNVFLGLFPPPLIMMSAAELWSRIKGKKSLVVLAARAGHFKEMYREIPRDLCKCSCMLLILSRCQPLHLLCKQHPHPSHIFCGETCQSALSLGLF